MSQNSDKMTEEIFKNPINKKKKLTNYNKKQVLATLKETSCHPKHLHTMHKRFRVTDVDIIKTFINTQAEAAQTRLEQTAKTENNKAFLNLDQCARSLSEECKVTTDNTLPVTLAAIADLEEHPPPSAVGGVDLKALYRLLANVTNGQPVADIEDEPTKEFLKQCYAELIDSVSETDAKSFKSHLIEQDKQTQPVYSWLCNSDYRQYLSRIFKDICNDENDE